MQSSTMVALRTMTMIVCLVAVPLAAVLGTTWSKVVKSAFGQRETRPMAESVSAARPDTHGLAAADLESHDIAPTAMSEDGSLDASSAAIRKPAVGRVNAPVGRPSRPSGAEDGLEGRSTAELSDSLAETAEPAALPQVHITGVRPADDAPGAVVERFPEQTPIETAPLWNPSPRTASSVRGGETTTHFVPTKPPAGGDHEQPKPDVGGQQDSYGAKRRPGRRDDSLRKTVYSPTDDDDRPVGALAAGNSPANERLMPVERVSNDGVLADGQRRLAELGVKYYRLEPWGEEGAFYRCSCDVPFSPRGRARRHFDAIESAPSLALEAVVRQVEAWRARR